MFTTPQNDGLKCLANFALSYGKRYNLMQKYEKLLDYVSDFIIFCMPSPNLTQMFSKSASKELSKQPICGHFGCFALLP